MTNIFDKICLQESINLYGGEHGKVINVLENRKYITKGHVELSFGIYRDCVSIITFKGSDGTADWIDNFKFWQTEDKIGTFKAHIHKGFDEQWNTIKPIVDALLNGVDNFIFAGHSLGGALATRAALDYIGRKKFDVITFGSPRVMDYQTTLYFNNNIETSRRFTYRNDIVTHVPTAFLNFCHVKGHVALGESSFWNKINPIKSVNDHKPENYLSEITKDLLRSAKIKL